MPSNTVHVDLRVDYRQTVSVLGGQVISLGTDGGPIDPLADEETER